MTEPSMRTLPPPVAKPEFSEDPHLLARVSRALRHDRQKLALLIAIAAVGYLFFAVLLFLTAPSQRVTRLPFRVEFEGAERGFYPSRIKFSESDIVALPVLLKIYQQDHLDRFTNFAKFSGSIFLNETNPVLEQLDTEYAARWADRSLGPTERERVEREYQLKKASIPRTGYSVNYAPADDARRIPDSVVEQVLRDILQTWAANAVQNGALRLPVMMLSDDIARTGGNSDPLIEVFQLRARTRAIMANVARLSEVPGASTARLVPDGVSLEDISFRLENLLRFEIEPLAFELVSRTQDSPRTIEAINSCLAYYERQLRSAEASAAAIRDTLSTYQRPSVSVPVKVTNETRAEGSKTETPNVVPQVTDSFIDRLLSLTDQSSDREFRQSLAKELEETTLRAIPFRSEVEYYERILSQTRGGHRTQISAADASISSIHADLDRSMRQLTTLYVAITRNMNPSTYLYSITGPPVRFVSRGVSLSRLAIYGVAFLAAFLLVLIMFTVVRERIRYEEQLEQSERAA